MARARAILTDQDPIGGCGYGGGGGDKTPWARGFHRKLVLVLYYTTDAYEDYFTHVARGLARLGYRVEQVGALDALNGARNSLNGGAGDSIERQIARARPDAVVWWAGEAVDERAALAWTPAGAPALYVRAEAGALVDLRGSRTWAMPAAPDRGLLYRADWAAAKEVDLLVLADAGAHALLDLIEGCALAAMRVEILGPAPLAGRFPRHYVDEYAYADLPRLLDRARAAMVVGDACALAQVRARPDVVLVDHERVRVELGGSVYREIASVARDHRRHCARGGVWPPPPDRDAWGAEEETTTPGLPAGDGDGDGDVGAVVRCVGETFSGYETELDKESETNRPRAGAASRTASRSMSAAVPWAGRIHRVLGAEFFFDRDFYARVFGRDKAFFSSAGFARAHVPFAFAVPIEFNAHLFAAENKHTLDSHFHLMADDNQRQRGREHRWFWSFFVHATHSTDIAYWERYMDADTEQTNVDERGYWRFADAFRALRRGERADALDAMGRLLDEYPYARINNLLARAMADEWAR